MVKKGNKRHRQRRRAEFQRQRVLCGYGQSGWLHPAVRTYLWSRVQIP